MITKNGPKIPVPRRWLALNGALVVLLFVVSLGIGKKYYRQHWKAWGTANFYQPNILSPAVSFACSGRFVDLNNHPGITQTPATLEHLNLFLSTELASFNCAELRVDPFDEIDGFERPHFYLIWSVAWVWKVFGVSWPALGWLAGLLYGLCAVFSFLLFRTWLGWLPSLVLTLPVVYLESFRQYIPGLRDFGRAPFFLFFMAFVFWLPSVYRPKNISGWIYFGVGVVGGIGFRFRADCLLGFLFGLLSFLIIQRLRREFLSRETLRALATITLGFFIFSVAMLRPWRNFLHHPASSMLVGNLVHGLMENETLELGLVPADYRIGAMASDYEVLRLVDDYEHRYLKVANLTTDQRFASFYFGVTRLFPADLVTRVLASIRKVSELPVEDIIYPEKSAGVFTQAAFLFSLSAILFLGLNQSILFWVFIFAFIFLGGYPSLRFQSRHYFFLEPLTWLLWGLFVYGAFEKVKRMFSERNCFPVYWMPGRRNGIIWAVIVGIGLFGGFAALRRYQVSTLENLITSYFNSPAQPIAFSDWSSPIGSLLFKSGTSPAAHLRFGQDSSRLTVSETRFLHLYFNPNLCSVRRIHVVVREHFREDSSGRETDAEQFLIPMQKSRNSHLFVPVYNTSLSTFTRFAIPETERGCLYKIESVSNEKFPLQLSVFLADDWLNSAQLYQRFP